MITDIGQARQSSSEVHAKEKPKGTAQLQLPQLLQCYVEHRQVHVHTYMYRLWFRSPHTFQTLADLKLEKKPPLIMVAKWH